MSSITPSRCAGVSSKPLPPYSEKVLELLLSSHRAYVPVLWLYEVAAVPTKSERTGALTAQKALGFLEDLRSLDIVVDEEGFARILGDVHRLAVEQRLTAYDAAYLELAVRKQLPLASLDQDLNKAAVAVGVPLFQG